jgi:hypothetical protein
MVSRCEGLWTACINPRLALRATRADAQERSQIHVAARSCKIRSGGGGAGPVSRGNVEAYVSNTGFL